MSYNLSNYTLNTRIENHSTLVDFAEICLAPYTYISAILGKKTYVFSVDSDYLTPKGIIRTPQTTTTEKIIVIAAAIILSPIILQSTLLGATIEFSVEYFSDYKLYNQVRRIIAPINLVQNCFNATKQAAFYLRSGLSELGSEL